MTILDRVEFSARSRGLCLSLHLVHRARVGRVPLRRQRLPPPNPQHAGAQVHLSEGQCDQIGLFLKVLGNKFAYGKKVVQKYF